MRGGGRLDLLPGAGVQEKVLLGKTAVTFAYDLGLRRFLNENCREKNYNRFSPTLTGSLNLFLRKKAGVFGVLRLDVGIG